MATLTAPESVSPEYLSIYIHIPFCRTRCSYCSFNTYTGLEALVEPYLAALQHEIALVAQNRSDLAGHTLYLGGGTPSLLTPVQVEAIIMAVCVHLGLLPTAEITLEANPGTVDAAKLAAFRAAGVNRLSLGVQSIHADELRLFGRSHSFADATDAFHLARRAGFDNISVDLIYGAPYQTRRSWRETLEAVLAWNPEHISLYSLTIETGTPLHHRIERGDIPSPDPDLAADMYEDARARLAQAGFRQYEISNWAQPGCESVHNRQYWLNRPYLGFGAGAHGAACKLRYWNVASVQDYIARIARCEPQNFPLSPAVEGWEAISERLAMSETVILGLRLVREGISRTDFARRFGCTLDQVFGLELERLERIGLIEDSGDAIRLTERAYLLSNQVFWRLLPADD